MSEVITNPRLLQREKICVKSELSIVFSMYNSKLENLQIIRDFFLPSLLNNLNSKTQLVIIDDGSPLHNETTQLIQGFMSKTKNLAGEVIFKRFGKNHGFAEAYNEGIRISDGKIIMILNDDIYLPKGSIDSMVQVLLSDKQIGAVGPVIDNCWSSQSIILFNRISDLSLEELNKIENFSIWLRKVMKGEKYEIIGNRETLVGCCLCFKCEVIDKVGFFDNRFKYGLFEDNDWIKRVKLHGYNVVLDAATFIEHGGPKGGSYTLRQNHMRHFVSMFVNAIKFGTKWNCLGILPLILAKEKIQSCGIMSIQTEIIRIAKNKGLWDEYVRYKGFS